MSRHLPLVWADETISPPPSLGSIVDIPGQPGRWVFVDLLYESEVDPCLCAVCGGVGIPWAGWFSCGDCPAISVVADGRTFVPLPAAIAKAEGG